MISEEQYKLLETTFPEIKLIEAPELRQKVATAWIETLHESTFEKIEDIPYGSGPMSRWNVAEHVRATTRNAIELAKTAKEIYKFDQFERGRAFSMDDLIAACLLHEVGGLLTKEKDKNGEVHKSELGETFNQSFVSGLQVKKYGLSDKITHIIFMHSYHPPHCFFKPRYIESIFIHFGGVGGTDSARFVSGLSTHLEKRGWAEGAYRTIE